MADPCSDDEAVPFHNGPDVMYYPIGPALELRAVTGKGRIFLASLGAKESGNAIVMASAFPELLDKSRAEGLTLQEGDR